MTERFDGQHGNLNNLLQKVLHNQDLELQGELDDSPAPTQYLGSGPWSYDFSGHTKQDHPGTGEEFKTLVYVELKGGWDGATGFVNIKDEQEIHLWCVKRGHLTEAYCNCIAGDDDDDDTTCPQFVLKTAPGESVPESTKDCEDKIYKMGHTEGHTYLHTAPLHPAFPRASLCCYPCQPH